MIRKRVSHIFPYASLFRGVPDYVQTTVELALELHRSEPPGDILAFLTGQDEVEHACDVLRKAAASLSREHDRLVVLPLYSGLPVREQVKLQLTF